MKLSVLVAITTFKNSLHSIYYVVFCCLILLMFVECACMYEFVFGID